MDPLLTNSQEYSPPPPHSDAFRVGGGGGGGGAVQGINRIACIRTSSKRLNLSNLALVSISQ